jgi:hypothetical protein
MYEPYTIIWSMVVDFDGFDLPLASYQARLKLADAQSKLF